METNAPKKQYPYGYAYQQAVIEASELLGLKSGPHLVLTKLVGFCNKKTGQCYPSKETLAWAGRQNVRTVQRHLRTLEAIGLIIPFAYRTGGKERATVYTFALPQWSKPAFPTNDAKLAWLAQPKGDNLSLKGDILSLYHDNLSPQQDRTIYNKGDDAPASRGEGGNQHYVTFDQIETVVGEVSAKDIRKCCRLDHVERITFTHLGRGMRDKDAKQLWELMEPKEALRAAENG